jgi:hypothetical protein
MSVQRFTLDQSPLDDEAYGLDGASPAFTLDTNSLDQGVLDGTDFTTIGVAAASGSLTATAEADVTVVIQSIGVAELGAITADAVASVAHFATGAASASATATATTAITNFAIGNASLGSLTASSTAAVTITASAASSLGIISADATATVTHTATAITTADLTATASAIVGSVNAGFAPLGEITATATATITPSVMPSGGGGRITWVDVQQRPLPKPEPIVEPEPVKVQEPKPVLKPKPSPVRVVSSAASAEFGALTSGAFANISWVAELDDLEVLELI